MTLAGIGPVAGTDPSLMGLAARSEYFQPIGIARMGWAFPLHRCLSTRSCGLSYRSLARQISKVPSCRLSSSFAALQGLSRTSPAGPSRNRRLLGLSFPDDTIFQRDSAHAGFACPPPSALRVSLPSRRFSPSPDEPTLFHAGGACGVRPSEHSPRRRSVDITADPAPLAVTRRSRFDEPRVHRSWDLKTGFRVLPQANPWPSTGTSPDLRWLLPWDSVPSRGFGRPPCPAFQPTSSHVLVR